MFPDLQEHQITGSEFGSGQRALLPGPNHCRFGVHAECRCLHGFNRTGLLHAYDAEDHTRVYPLLQEGGDRRGGQTVPVLTKMTTQWPLFL